MNVKEHALIKLSEECAEVIQACSKIMRFGPYSHHPDGGGNNLYDLRLEVAGLLASIEVMEKQWDLEHPGIEMINAARVRGEKYLSRSIELGLVEEKR